MLADTHIHMILDGENWKHAIDAHRTQPDDEIIRRRLRRYRDLGVRFLRDGGDRWGVSARAARLAPQYGIDYRTPVFPIHKKGHYGGWIGRGFERAAEFTDLVRQVGQCGGDFVKLMVSDIMDFGRFGALCGQSLRREEIAELVRICHDAGFAVMAHCNGAEACRDAVLAGVDSLEHGGYLDEDAAHALAESETVWVPTLSTVGNLIGSGRYPDDVLRRLLTHQTQMVSMVYRLGGSIALGSDAGAYRVRHGSAIEDELRCLTQAIDANDLMPHLQCSEEKVKQRFCRK